MASKHVRSVELDLASNVMSTVDRQPERGGGGNHILCYKLLFVKNSL